MSDEMSWKECTEKGIIFKTTPDYGRAKQLLEMAKLRLAFWNQPIDNRFATLKIEAYYEAIKELILAHIYKNGLNCTNHLCLIAYLREKFTNFGLETQKIDELRQLRNSISYRGFFITKDYLDRNETEIKQIIARLKETVA